MENPVKNARAVVFSRNERMFMQFNGLRSNALGVLSALGLSQPMEQLRVSSDAQLSDEEKQLCLDVTIPAHPSFPTDREEIVKYLGPKGIEVSFDDEPADRLAAIDAVQQKIDDAVRSRVSERISRIHDARAEENAQRDARMNLDVLKLLCNADWGSYVETDEFSTTLKSGHVAALKIGGRTALEKMVTSLESAEVANNVQLDTQAGSKFMDELEYRIDELGAPFWESDFGSGVRILQDMLAQYSDTSGKPLGEL